MKFDDYWIISQTFDGFTQYLTDAGGWDSREKKARKFGSRVACSKWFTDHNTGGQATEILDEVGRRRWRNENMLPNVSGRGKRGVGGRAR